MNFDSKEEEYFYWWILELQQRDIIAQTKYQPKPFQLFKGTEVTFIEQLKTKTKERKVKLLPGHQYQADFLIYWNPKVHRKIFADYNDVLDVSIKQLPFVANYSEKKDCYFSVIDVKGTYNQHDAWRRFSIDQKWVFQKFGIYVQKTITHPAFDKKGRMIPANALFPRTFLPKMFTRTDSGRFKRKIKYDYILVDAYLKRIGIQ